MSVSPQIASEQADRRSRSNRSITIGPDGNYAGRLASSNDKQGIREAETGPPLRASSAAGEDQRFGGTPLPFQTYALFCHPTVGFEHAAVALEVTVDGKRWVTLQTLEITGSESNAIFASNCLGLACRWNVKSIVPSTGALDLYLIASN